MDEAGLYWKMSPTRTISKKTKKISGLKLAKSRSTVLVGGNATGDLKLKPLWIHNSQTPRSFRRKVKKDKSNLPVYWASNKKTFTKAGEEFETSSIEDEVEEKDDDFSSDED